MAARDSELLERSDATMVLHESRAVRCVLLRSVEGNGPRTSTRPGGSVEAAVANRAQVEGTYWHACARPSLEVPMWWMVGLVLMGFLGRALAEDSRGGN